MICARVILSLCSRWMAEVARKTWIRGFWAYWTASQARSMSRSLQRARPQTVAPVTSVAMARTASKSPSEAIGKPASMMSTPSAGEGPGHLELLGQVHARARRLLAVAQGRVEDPDAVRVVGRNGQARAWCSWLGSFSRNSGRCGRTASGNEKSPEIHRSRRVSGLRCLLERHGPDEP